MDDRTPTFNLKAVVRETGLKPDTLRAWERRYGVPSPDRTDSGHRLYSQHDIDTLKWLLERQQEGMSISRAVELWHGLEADGADPLQAAITPGNQRTVVPTSLIVKQDSGTFGDGGAIARLRETWVQACLVFDEHTAEQLLSEAFAYFSTEVVCIELIQKGLAQIGKGWYEGNVTVQQEHFASALALRRMEALLSSTPAPTRPGRIMVGCPPEEEHTFVPLMLSLLLRRRGWDVIYLGANVPIRSLEATISAVHPNLVILTAQQLSTAASLMEMAEVLLRERVPVAFGGLVFTQVSGLYRSIPGYYLGDKLEEATAEVEQVMASLRPRAAEYIVDYEYREALDHFRSRQSSIESEVWERLEQTMPKRQIGLANQSFGRNILAALTLGDLDYLDTDLDWVEGLLVNHNQLPADALDHYLETYLEAAIRHLDQRGAIIVHWLARLVGRELPSTVRPGQQIRYHS